VVPILAGTIKLAIPIPRCDDGAAICNTWALAVGVCGQETERERECVCCYNGRAREGVCVCVCMSVPRCDDGAAIGNT